jgi:hypothetical protein
MSIVAMKNKAVVRYGSNRSGKPPGGIWLSQGPFGAKAAQFNLSMKNYGPVGFSLSGTHRNVGYVGQNMRMSKSGTPFRGVHAMGNGGCCGTYDTKDPVINSRVVETMGDQYQYVKPSVVSQRGMLRKKYKYLYNGQYPNYIVKDVQSGDMTDNKSQQVYIDKLAAANDCVQDINNSKKFEGFKVKCGPTGCSTTTAKYKYNTMASNGPYTKFTKNPIDSSSQTLRIQRQCANPPADKRPQPVPGNGNQGPCAFVMSSVLL